MLQFILYTAVDIFFLDTPFTNYSSTILHLHLLTNLTEALEDRVDINIHCQEMSQSSNLL
jgi:hypothetical protein